MRSPSGAVSEQGDPIAGQLDVKIADPGLSRRYTATLIKDVAIRPSPYWMQRRLSAIGLRPINALVDITNYFTYDRGRPLHVFDAAKVKGNLTVRNALDEERVDDATRMDRVPGGVPRGGRTISGSISASY